MSLNIAVNLASRGRRVNRAPFFTPPLRGPGVFGIERLRVRAIFRFQPKPLSETRSMPDSSPSSARLFDPPHSGGAAGLLEGLGAVAVAAAICTVAAPWLSIADAALTLLLAVLLTAIRRGRGPAAAAAIAGFLALNFLFTEPRYTLLIADMRNVLTVFYFLLVAAVASDLAARARAKAEAARAQAAQAESLRRLERELSDAADPDDALQIAADYLAASTGGEALALTPANFSRPPLDAAAAAAAEWTWRNREPAGAGTATAATLPWLFTPLKNVQGEVSAVLALRPADTPEARRLARAVAGQAAIAVERLTLAAQADAARMQAERERLRSSLLSSLSHDLRTPLASILGAASSLHAYGDALSPQSRGELVQTVQDEAERLNRFVQNLLDMTRIGAGELRPKADWLDAADIVDQALTRAKPALGDRPLVLALDSALPLLRGDPLLLTQALVNLLDNAGKYAPPDQPVTVSVAVAECGGADGWAEIAVADRGPGVAPTDRERVFDMFFRGEINAARPAGTGLGLAICRGLVEAHGGSVRVEDGEEKGARFVIRLPLPAAPEVDADSDEAAS